MKKAFLKSLALAVVGSVCVAGSALAAPITGGISMTGTFIPVDTSGSLTTIPLSTGIDFGKYVNLAANDDNTFQVTTGTFDFKDIVGYVGTINNFQFVTPSTPVQPLWEVGGYSFEMTSLSFFKREVSNSYFVDVYGAGMLSKAGY
ncbi:MAG: hypothetical protein EHM86_06655, partial [Desulfobulbaceae bacterium]